MLKSVVLTGKIPVLYPFSISFQYLGVMLVHSNKTASQPQHFFPDFPIIHTGKRTRIWIFFFLNIYTA